MKLKAIVVFMCTSVVCLYMLSCHAQKLNIHWGPQSMMYLKGKYGRRFVSEDVKNIFKSGLQGSYAVLRDIQRRQSWELSKPGHIVSSEKVLIPDLQQR